MTKTLATLISNVQALLLDDGTRYTTATVTAAIRSALKEINQRAPVNAAELTETIDDQLEYEITDTGAIEINDILLWDSTGDRHTVLDYDPYNEDERLFFRLRSAQASGDFLIARYTIPHTINGLDSSVESTIPAFYDDILIDGACYWSAVIRAMGRVETINLNQNVPDTLDDVKRLFREAFDKGLNLMAKKRAPVSEPDTRAWNDQYHGWTL
jgi:hypothetical protein